ncbi:MAG: hypothetical protein ACFB50_17820 [Rubrobacteraceae bacterium]
MIVQSSSRYSERSTNLPATREAWSGMWIVVGVIGTPVLLTMASLLFFHAVGMAWTEISWVVFYLTAFLSYFVLLPLAAGLAVRTRERKQKIAGEMMAFFSQKVTALYVLAKENPALSADARTAEVFEIYSRADREVEENVQNPLFARETIERGVFLADEVLESHDRPR